MTALALLIPDDEDFEWIVRVKLLLCTTGPAWQDSTLPIDTKKISKR